MRGATEHTGRHWKKAAALPVFLFANVALLLVIGTSTIRETYRGWTVDREIRALEDQSAALEGRKSALETLTRDLVSPDRISVEARARLDQKLPGERVIVLQGISSTGTWQDETTAKASYEMPERQLSNPERWWRYFFQSKS